jgi:hypothetical protein
MTALARSVSAESRKEFPVLQIGGLVAFENAADIDAGLPIGIVCVSAVVIVPHIRRSGIAINIERSWRLYRR